MGEYLGLYIHPPFSREASTHFFFFYELIKVFQLIPSNIDLHNLGPSCNLCNLEKINHVIYISNDSHVSVSIQGILIMIGQCQIKATLQLYFECVLELKFELSPYH